MIIRATEKETLVLAELARRMWNDHTVSELEADFKDIVSNSAAVCFIKYADKRAVGFAQCQLRYDYVEGTHSSPVGYLEGIFISPGYQKKGYGRELLRECEKWAMEKGCTEFASDCELDNTGSLDFHLAMGFSETNRIICFRKEI